VIFSRTRASCDPRPFAGKAGEWARNLAVAKFQLASVPGITGTMRRKRFHHETKVWRDPLLAPAASRGGGSGAAPSEEDDRQRRRAPIKRNGARIIAGPAGPSDPKELERARLLERLLLAEGRPSISRACEEILGAGFELPRAQEVWLQVLEHSDEGRVAQAISELAGILDDEEPKRRAVLESRLRRIEEFADDAGTQRAAKDLRRTLNTKYAETLS
jgi:hypothetical protein